jgi:hypothetical protein
VISQHLLGAADAGIDQDSAAGVGHEVSVYRPFLEHCCQVQPRHLQGHPSSPVATTGAYGIGQNRLSRRLWVSGR